MNDSATSSWGKMAQADIEFIYQSILANHAGPKDLDNPTFLTLLNASYTESFAASKKIQDEQDYRILLAKFISCLQDNHIVVVFDQHPPLQVRTRSQREKQSYIEQFNQGITWIRIPSFHPGSKEQEDGLKDTIEKSKLIRDSSAIVFDVRGNGGGSAIWGQQLLNNIFGEDFISSLSKNTT